jgi:hypothetical protein
MPKCGKIGADTTASWGAGTAIFSPVVRRVVLPQVGHAEVSELKRKEVPSFIFRGRRNISQFKNA